VHARHGQIRPAQAKYWHLAEYLNEFRLERETAKCETFAIKPSVR
jgi:hypothetical protein